ncbi:ATP-binding protein [Ktedonobacter sp. SOSP1-52]|uniref:ATP-binding protein n=1 Tax=Ktedonobacter sp. SOSP1-52 TaxID=2778366 RepID=UPI0035AEC64D
MGLGLYLFAEIIKRHGGHMWLESKPEQGPTFYFSLPLVREQEQASDFSTEKEPQHD